MGQAEYLKTPLWNSSLSVKERLAFLLSEMTVDEKLKFLATTTPALERLGITPFHIGGEAAHGIEARHDQDGIGVPEITTSFPQPIGMSATWDTRLIEEAGKVVGTEGRVLWKRHKTGGLSRWAPTVDMERDPRWGRTEEAYGEDPYLTGKMASAYVRGMQGTDGRYLRMAASLKHFYANNVEEGRVWKSSSVDPRNKYEYYLEPFRRVVEEGHAEAMMTAYNEINGIPAILNHEVQNLVKDEWGLRGHVVCDGGDMSQTVDFHHYYGTHAQTVAEGLKAGVDCFTDDPEMVETAARQAYELGLISEGDIDRALANSFGTKIRLGIYDGVIRNPYDLAGEENIHTSEADALSAKMAREGCVLLKNQDGFLPLNPSDRIALIGPVADVWYHDWYGGEPPCKVTLREGIAGLTQKEVICETGLSEIRLRCGERYVRLDEKNRLTLDGGRENAEVFVYNDWGSDSHTFQAKSANRFVTLREDGVLYADKEEAFGWFIKESFGIRPQDDGGVCLLSWDKKPITENSEGCLVTTSETEDGKPAQFVIETIRDSLKEAIKAAAGAEKVILALGCNPVINSKEEVDRSDLSLPPFQEELAETVLAVNSRAVLVLLTNYPYAIGKLQEKLPAVLQSATGSQQMGRAVADVLYGEENPAGRLPMTWYQSVEDLPDMDDYDIRKGKRTYRWFDREVLYPFGYGLSFTSFSYSGLNVRIEDFTCLTARFTVTNTGDRIGDEVAQIYLKAPDGCRVERPKKQLAGFVRLKDLRPGESREVVIPIPLSELRYYDVISRSFLVEEGNYTFFAGGSSADEAVSASVWVNGQKPGHREGADWTAADHYDDYENIYLHRAYAGLSCAVIRDTEREGTLLYRDFRLAEDTGYLTVCLKCEREGTVTLKINGRKAAYVETADLRHFSDVCVPLLLEKGDKNDTATVELILSGDVRIARFRFL